MSELVDLHEAKDGYQVHERRVELEEENTFQECKKDSDMIQRRTDRQTDIHEMFLNLKGKESEISKPNYDCFREKVERVTKIENIKTDSTKILRPTHFSGPKDIKTD
jgi:hypothetical protein